ncbi:MAG: DNA-protecting protein DprA [Deltaproteobacteria bacterium]|nr:DNA-protecting protein DprA [Deltaproteobacteria bacterium]
MSASEETSLACLALGRVRGLGCAGFKKLIDHFGDPRRVFTAPEKELAEIPGLDRQAIDGILSFAGWNEVREEMQRALDLGAAILPFDAPGYPARLRSIDDPPPCLYLKGEFQTIDENAVAIVGSRSASEYGLKVTRDLSRGLATFGFTVVSGMARGIDGEAHAAALQAGGRTAAVLGSGVDVVYPPEHEGLYADICRSGAVFSELAMGRAPFSYNFPSRNRLISGIAVGVVVVEATERSGSLITARLALEQGREVFAVPGAAGSSRSRGTHQLIRQGAKLVETVQDVVEEIAPQLRSRAAVPENSQASIPPGLSEDAARLWEMIREGPAQIDELISASSLSPAKVTELLLDLEIRGVVKQLPGKRFKV